MHDGSMATLREVVDFYDKGGNPNPGLDPLIGPLYLSEADKEALVAFMRTLTSPNTKPLAAAAPGEGAIEAATLPGGPVLFAVHSGLYDQLNETYVAMERWMEANGTRPGGAPWES